MKPLAMFALGTVFGFMLAMALLRLLASPAHALIPVRSAYALPCAGEAVGANYVRWTCRVEDSR